MKKLHNKLIFSFSSFLAANLWLIGKGVQKGSANFFISATVEETLIFVLLQILVIIIYMVRPIEVKKSRVIYWCISEVLVLVTVFIWGIFIVGPIWLK